jgi:hypothetical protein
MVGPRLRLALSGSRASGTLAALAEAHHGGVARQLSAAQRDARAAEVRR